jgi:hypothetical protein
MAAMRTVSGKRVVVLVFGGIALILACTIYWFVQHARDVRDGGVRATEAPTTETTR